MSELPPGPAWIMAHEAWAKHSRHSDGDILGYEAPRQTFGYIWTPATEGTPAGWRRPHGMKG